MAPFVVFWVMLMKVVPLEKRIRRRCLSVEDSISHGKPNAVPSPRALHRERVPEGWVRGALRHALRLR